jgi:hypothetical protein
VTVGVVTEDVISRARSVLAYVAGGVAWPVLIQAPLRALCPDCPRPPHVFDAGGQFTPAEPDVPGPERPWCARSGTAGKGYAGTVLLVLVISVSGMPDSQPAPAPLQRPGLARISGKFDALRNFDVRIRALELPRSVDLPSYPGTA